jgi:ribosomal protein S18 acetylase RimI-like enzyme/predicted  nucleic acid-binding Zn-ribbon protein
MEKNANEKFDDTMTLRQYVKHILQENFGDYTQRMRDGQWGSDFEIRVFVLMTGHTVVITQPAHTQVHEPPVGRRNPHHRTFTLRYVGSEEKKTGHYDPLKPQDPVLNECLKNLFDANRELERLRSQATTCGLDNLSEKLKNDVERDALKTTIEGLEKDRIDLKDNLRQLRDNLSTQGDLRKMDQETLATLSKLHDLCSNNVMRQAAQITNLRQLTLAERDLAQNKIYHLNRLGLAVERQRDDAQKELVIEKAKLAALETERNGLQADLAACNGKLKAIDDGTCVVEEGAEGQNQSLRADVGRLTKELEDCERKFAQLGKAYDDQTNGLERLRRYYEERLAQSAAAHKEEVERINELGRDVEQQRNEAQQKLYECETKVAQLEAAHKDEVERLNQLGRDVEQQRNEAQQKLYECETKVAQHEAAHKEEVERINKLGRSVKQQRDEARKERDDAKQKLQGVRKRLKECENNSWLGVGVTDSRNPTGVKKFITPDSPEEKVEDASNDDTKVTQSGSSFITSGSPKDESKDGDMDESEASTNDTTMVTQSGSSLTDERGVKRPFNEVSKSPRWRRRLPKKSRVALENIWTDEDAAINEGGVSGGGLSPEGGESGEGGGTRISGMDVGDGAGADESSSISSAPSSKMDLGNGAGAGESSSVPSAPSSEGNVRIQYRNSQDVSRNPTPPSASEANSRYLNNFTIRVSQDLGLWIEYQELSLDPLELFIHRQGCIKLLNTKAVIHADHRFQLYHINDGSTLVGFILLRRWDQNLVNEMVGDPELGRIEVGDLEIHYLCIAKAYRRQNIMARVVAAVVQSTQRRVFADVIRNGVNVLFWSSVQFVPIHVPKYTYLFNERPDRRGGMMRTNLDRIREMVLSETDPAPLLNPMADLGGRRESDVFVFINEYRDL